MTNEYEEMENLINEAADNYRTIEEILSEHNLTVEQALIKSNEFCRKFFDILGKKGIESFNVSKMCRDIFSLLDTDVSDETIFIYTALLTENGLLFGGASDEEQKIQLWLDQYARVELLSELIKKEPEYKTELSKLRKYKSNAVTAEIDREEQSLIYSMAVENTFLYKYRNSNILLENIGELVRQVNASEIYRKIKPYIYFAVLTRRHKLMTEHKNYTPNIPKIFDYKEYKIYKDNGKNFNTYQSYLEFYGQLRESYEGEIDGEFTDYCMANTSNLTEWFFNNCEPAEFIPMSLLQTCDCLSTTILITPKFEFELDLEDENTVLDIAYINELSNEEQWRDFVCAMQNGEDITKYAERLYKQANTYIHYGDCEKALMLAKLYLYDYIEEYNRQLLVSAANKFQDKTVTEK